MRATTRITWLLLSISFLIHNVCSDGDDPAATSVKKDDDSVSSAPSVSAPADGTKSKTEPTTVKTITTVGSTIGAPPGGAASDKNEPTQPTTPAKTTPAKTTPAVTTPLTTVPATTKPTDKPAPTESQASPTVTDKPPAPLTSISSAQSTVKNDATTSATVPSQPLTPAVPTVRSSSSSPDVTTAQTADDSVSGKTSGTPAPVNVGTTELTKVSTDAPTPEQQSRTHTTITTKTSQDTKGGTEKTTVTIIIQEQTTSKAPEPTGNPVTTTPTPSTPTRVGPPAAQTTGTKAGTMSPTTTTTTTTATTSAQPKTFLYSLNTGHEREDKKDLVEVCRRLMVNLQDGNCTLTYQHHNGKILFDYVEINGKVKTTLANQYYEDITKKPTDNKTLIAILASCGALLIMIVILAVCASHHRKPYHENQQHLTEELHTVENGYHDNPTLEVMEVQPEMQEKKMALNGEFNDSWIVPIDNLLKEDIPDEEDTHL